MIEVDGPLWLAGALLVCVAHVLYLRGWRREQREQLAWWQRYVAAAQERHEEFMRAMDKLDGGATLGWSLDGNRDRGQA